MSCCYFKNQAYRGPKSWYILGKKRQRMLNKIKLDDVVEKKEKTKYKVN